MIRIRRSLLALGLGSLFVPLLACVSLPSAEEVRSVTLAEEWRLGAHLAADLDHQLTVSPDAEAQALLSELGQGLVEAGSLEDREWRFVLFLDPEPRAFSAPGGQVFVSAELVRAAENASRFVGLLAHQVAHVQLRHGSLLLSRAHGPETMLALARGEQRGLRQDIAANLAAAGTLNRFSESAETAADREALRLLAAGGHDARGLPEGLARLGAVNAENRRRSSRTAHCYSPERQRLGELEAYRPLPGDDDRHAVEEDARLFALLRERVAR